MGISTIEILKNYFAGRGDVKLAYAFGSQVTGNAGPLSDYDISILPKVELDRKIKYVMSSELTKILRKPVDVVIFNKAPIELRFNIISNNILLFALDDYMRVEVEVTTMSLYYDSLPGLIKLRNELIREVNYDTSIQRYRKAFRKTEEVLGKIRAASRETNFRV